MAVFGRVIDPTDDANVYVKFPELSLEGFHASETLKGVLLVTRKFPGLVGADRSRSLAENAMQNKANKVRKGKPLAAEKQRHGASGVLMFVVSAVRIAIIWLFPFKPEVAKRAGDTFAAIGYLGGATMQNGFSV